MRNLTLRLPAALVLLASCLVVSTSGCNGTSGWTRNQVGKRNYQSGNYTAARRSFEQALMNDPWNPNYAFNVAAAMQKQGDHLAAERMYQHALTLNPSHQPSYHAMAGLLHQDGRTEEAQELLAAWVDTQPYMPESHVEMAWMHQELGNYDAAEASLEQALQRNPRHARAMAQLGQVYQQTGRQAEAAAYYNRSLAYDRRQAQVAAQMNGMGLPGQYSPSLMMAQQLPQYDPTLTAFPQFGASPYGQPQTYNAATPYTARMAGSPAYNSPMSGMGAAHYGSSAMLPSAGFYGAPTGQYSDMRVQPVSMTTSGSAGPMYTTAGFEVPATDGYAPPQVQLGAPMPSLQSPGALAPVIGTTVPVVTPF